MPVAREVVSTAEERDELTKSARSRLSSVRLALRVKIRLSFTTACVESHISGSSNFQ
jgi:hypothetical protein